MTTRTSAGIYLQVLEPAAAVATGIEIDVYDAANYATMLDTLEGARNTSYQKQLNQAGAGTFKINRHDAKATAQNMQKGNLCKVKIDGVYRGAFFMEETVRDFADPSGAGAEDNEIKGRGVMVYLERAVVYPTGWPATKLPDVTYTGATRGAILKDQIDQAKARGGLGAMTYDFTATVDSIGNPWTDTNTLTLHIGLNLFDLVLQLAALGTDFYMDPLLGLHAYQSLSIDRTGASGAAAVVFRQGKHIGQKALTVDEHNSAVRSRLLVEGSGNNIQEVVDIPIETDATVGRREGYLSYTSSGDTQALNDAGEALMQQMAADAQPLSMTVMHAASGYQNPRSVLQFTFNPVGGYQFINATSANGYTLGAGDYVEYDIYIDPANQLDGKSGLESNGGTALLGAVDQNGVSATPTTDLRPYALGRWYVRKIAVPVASFGFSFYPVFTYWGTATGTLVASYRNVRVTDGAGTVRKRVWIDPDQNPTFSLMYQSGGTSWSEALENDPVSSVGTGEYEPFVDYDVGDYALVDVPGAYDLAALRLVGLTIDQIEGGDFVVTGDFNSVYLEALIRIGQKTSGLSGGSSSSGSAPTGGGGAAGAGAGRAAVAVGDAPGYLFDKITAGAGITKTLLGSAPSETVGLSASGDPRLAAIPPAGTAGQALEKIDGTDYNTHWVTPSGVPPAGTAGQALEKIDGTDYNTHWVTPSGGGGSSENEAAASALINATSAGDAGNRADHFLGSALSGWTSFGTHTVVVANSVAGWLTNLGASAGESKAYTPSGACRIEARLKGAGGAAYLALGMQSVVGGLSSGEQMEILYDGIPQLRLVSTDGGTRNVRVTASGPGIGFHWLYLALARDGANLWTAQWSMDRSNWITVGTFSKTFAVAAMEWWAQNNTNIFAVGADFIDVVS